MRARNPARSLSGEMPVYAALLRGVMPTNCRMPELRSALEKAGFTSVRTVISSGNAVFKARSASHASLERKCEDATEKFMGRRFMTIVRPVDELEALLERDPFSKYKLPERAKRNVTFLRATPSPRPKLPVTMQGGEILTLQGREAFLYYVPGEVAPTFMGSIEKAFGKVQTTRTWDTVGRIVKAGKALA
jgi:uncharacterized protein (DUF1697 family)